MAQQLPDPVSRPPALGKCCTAPRPLVRQADGCSATSQGAVPTNFTLGTPPQTFRALVALNLWADLFVPSIASPNAGAHLKYNSSASSTYRGNGTIDASTHSTSEWDGGFISVDKANFGEVEVPQQPFLEIIKWEDLDIDVDGILGLAMDGRSYNFNGFPSYPHQVHGPFRSMVNQGVLDGNIFSLHLPHNFETGELLFGAINSSLYKGELAAHSLYPEDATFWQIQAASLSLVDANSGTLKNISLPSTSAIFESSINLMIFPNHIWTSFLEQIHPNIECWLPTYPCSRTRDLPDMVFNIGGREYVLTGEEYTLRFPGRICSEIEDQCMPAFTGPWKEDQLLLGRVFLRIFYSVFDFDARAVSLAEAVHKDSSVIGDWKFVDVGEVFPLDW